MKYFSGFALKGEEKFFKSMLVETDFTVTGFSYGAQKAFEYAYHSTERVDRLILFSPAFFQNEKKSFIKTQLRYYKADKEAYTQQFLKNVVYPSSLNLSENLSTGTLDELESLLTYTWDKTKLLELQNRGVIIEVFIGAMDKIVNIQESFNFFSEFITSTYLLKNEGHILQAIN